MMADLPSEFVHGEDPLARPPHWLTQQLRETTTRDDHALMRWFMEETA